VIPVYVIVGEVSALPSIDTVPGTVGGLVGNNRSEENTMEGQHTWTFDQIEVEVSGFFTTHHYFETAAGTFGEFTFPAFSQQGIFQTADGRALVMQKTSWLGSAHEVLDDGVVRGTADRRGLLSRDIIVQFDGLEYTLEHEGLFSQGWFLFDAEGNKLLETQPRGIFKQGAHLIIRGVVGVDLIAFVYYLIHMRQQEDAAVAAAASGAAAS
jgi:hypothetical protein